VVIEELVAGLDLSLLGRASWERAEAARDLEVLAWIGRFRFVTAEAIGERFGVSWQRANARVKRLERVGLVGTARNHVSEARAVFLTGRACELVGLRRRRAPRPEVQREHEAAIVWLVTRLELEGRADRVLTERECRRLERVEDQRFSVDVAGRYGQEKRWPDVVAEQGDQRIAFEIEFAPKGRERLRRIVEAYRFSPYLGATFLVRSPSLARTIDALAIGVPERCRLRVAPWPGLSKEQQAAVAAATLSPS
jgi:DNA-binding MarR family transcriptional regulator